MTLWTSAEAEAATLGHASKGFAVSGLSIDTRTLEGRRPVRGAARRPRRP